ncbi:MAG: lipid-binding SYLF domain-containing protein [Gammaproteobacteria bacterium]|nr:lipid-binding SYLF domain-containing protein [Gammaproteobacteria bacterium]
MRKAVVGITLFLLAAPLVADEKLDDRMMHSASILQEIRGPLEEDAPGVLEDAYAVAVFPEFVKVGLLGGVKHGRGVLAARLASGNWSKPAFVRITSGSFGLQFGVSMSQLLIVFKDSKAVEAISGGQFAIGADAGYAAGDLGGSASAGTDNRLENRIVAMARSKGLFAGVALEGGVLRIEKDANVEFYNNAIGLDGRTLLEDEEVELPPVAQHFLIVLDESVPPLSPEAPPVSWGMKALDKVDLSIDDRSPKAGQSDTQDPAGEGKGSGSTKQLAADGSVDPTQPPSRAVASARGTPASDSASQGAWITPDGAELPAGNAQRRITPDTTSTANWVSPEDAASVQGEASREEEQSRGSGLGGKIVGKVTEAAWDGAKELALESIRNKPEAQGAKVAAKVGEKLIDGSGDETRPKSPPKEPSRPPVATVANNGEWVDPLGEQADLPAAPSPMGNPDYPLASQTPDSLPAIASARNTDFTGPPAPTEWPQEWRDSQLLGGVCEPES